MPTYSICKIAAETMARFAAREWNLPTTIPRMLEIASVPATTVNWASHEMVSIEEWCAYIGELTGLEPKFEQAESTIASLPLDTTRMEELVGPARVSWRDGIARMIEARNPELLKR